jgi:putative peptidoglycan lipid II flippase
MTLLSRILGLVRDIFLANLMGAQAAMDVFLVAQKIPNFLRRLFAEGAFAQAFIPVLSEYQETKTKQDVLHLVSRVSGTLGVILFFVTIVGVLGSKGIATAFSPGFMVNSETKFSLVSELIKITFPYILFISMTAFAGSILNSLNKFAVPAFAPVLLNVCLISAAIWISPMLEQPVYGLAWAIFVAGVLQLLLHLPFLWRAGYLVKPVWSWHDSGVRKILKLMTPALFGVSVQQINLLLDTIIASFLVTGSVTWLYYSDRMLEFPLGIFGIAIATVIMPSLSRQYAAGDQQKRDRLLNWGLHLVMLIGLPAAVGLFVLAEPVMLTIFQHGEFTIDAAFRSGQSLQAYVVGLLSFMFVKVLATGFFSMQDTKTPVKIGVVALVTNMAFNLILFKPYGHVGLAMATTISASTNALLLWLFLVRKGVVTLSKQWLWWLARATFAAAAMVATISWAEPSIDVWRQWDNLARAYQLTQLIFIVAAVYLLLLVMLGFRPSDIKAP